jgi:hypothetical protein
MAASGTGPAWRRCGGQQRNGAADAKGIPCGPANEISGIPAFVEPARLNVAEFSARLIDENIGPFVSPANNSVPVLRNSRGSKQALDPLAILVVFSVTFR